MKIRYSVSGSNAFAPEIIETNEVYKDVAKKMSEIPVWKLPVDVRVENVDDESQYVEYNIKDRSGTQFTREIENTMPDDLTNEISNRYLTCIDESKNSYKKYVLCVSDAKVGDSESYKNNGDSREFTAFWGRMAVSRGDLFGEKCCTYPLTMFWPKFYEKIGKGYKDKTEFYFDSEAPKKEEPKKKRGRPRKVSEENKASCELFSTLLSWATNAVKEAKVNAPVTEAIIKESKRLLDEMRKNAEDDDSKSFENNLLELMAILQRPVSTGDGRGVRDMIHSGTMESIIAREDDLIQALEGVYSGKTVEVKGQFPLDIKVSEASEEQKEFVLNELPSHLRCKVKKVYCVNPTKQQEKFKDYCKRKNITKTKFLWHGSRNQNWLSIVQKSLLINPSGVSCNGKMFGWGIYFAPDADKSWGYTSYYGSRWAGGSSGSAFMGLYECAYGNPYFPNTSGRYEGFIKNSNYDCVHATSKNTGLCRDEIIFYDEDAICLKYIVEFN